MTKRRDE
jgi:Ras-related protein Rab-8A